MLKLHHNNCRTNERFLRMRTVIILMILITLSSGSVNETNATTDEVKIVDTETEPDDSTIYYIHSIDDDSVNDDDDEISSSAELGRMNLKNETIQKKRSKNKYRRHPGLRQAVQAAALKGLSAMIDLYERQEPEIYQKGLYLKPDHPGFQLYSFSAPISNDTKNYEKYAYAALVTAKRLQESINLDLIGLGRQNIPKITLKRTSLEGLCPPRENPVCLPASRRYRTHDGTCNNQKRLRWGAANMPFNRFLSPDYADGIEEIRGSVMGGPLPSARFVSLVVHGYREEEAPVTLMLPMFGQLVDHDITATMQPRSINGSVPSCCDAGNDLHPSCLPIKVPRDDPWLSPLGVRCLEFLRSAPAQRRDCLLSWREQMNQVTSYLDASSVYSSSPRQSDNSRILREGLLVFGRGNARDDPCTNGGFGSHCIKSGDARASEQPGLLALHTVFVEEHNRISLELANMNPHWSDEKLFQETRRIIGAMIQHITYREFLPLVLGKEVCRLFDLELTRKGFYTGYDLKTNPTIANAFSAAAFRFGHSLIQGTMLRSDKNHRFIPNNVSLHDENSRGDIGSHGSLHRIIRGLANQRALKRDEFMTPELTNHLFQSGSFPFGMDLAAINIQRGRDHGVPPYTFWRKPCGLSPVDDWNDMINVVGPKSTERLRRAYRHVDDIDLFVGGIAERPVVGGLVGPTFACIIAQQFSNLRKGDRFWYENPDFESSLTLEQLESVKQVSLSQILCRTLGGGTLQPHVFLPADSEGNSRQLCGFGVLAPIDLTPWLERDPFIKVDGFSDDGAFEFESSEEPAHKHDNIDRVDFFQGSRPIEHHDRFSSHIDDIPADRIEDFEDSPFNSDHSSSFLTSNSHDHNFFEPTQNKLDFPGQQTRPNNQPTKQQPNKQPNKQAIKLPVSTSVNKQKPANKNPVKVPIITEPLDTKLDFNGKPIHRPTVKRQPPTTTRKPKTTVTTTKRSVIKPVQNRPSAIKKRPTTTARGLKTSSKRQNIKVNPTRPNASWNWNRNKNNKNNNNKNKRPGNVEIRRSDDDFEDSEEESTTDDLIPQFFVNEDNATKYLYNLPIRPEQVIGSNLNIESRHNYGGGGFSSYQDYDGDFYDHNPNPYKPSYARPQKPYRQTTPPPPPPRPSLYGYRPDKPPQFEEPPRRPMTTTRFPTPISSPLSNRISTPFSYDLYGQHFVNSHVSYDNSNMKKPPNKVAFYRPTNSYRPASSSIYTTTRKPELQTFMIVETTKRTTHLPFYFDNTGRTTKRTQYSDKIDSINYPAFMSTTTTKRPNRYQYSGAYSNYDPIIDYDVTTTSLYYTRSTTRRPTKTHKYPYAERLTQEQLAQLLQMGNQNYQHDNDYTTYNDYFPSNPYTNDHVDHDHDNNYNYNNDNNDSDYVESEEFIRPDNRPQHISYHDYTKYNYKPNGPTQNKPTRVRYYYKGNVLYKYDEKHGLYDANKQMKRYADFYDLPFDDKEQDGYVRHLIDPTDVTDDTKTITISDKLDKFPVEEKLESRSRSDDISFSSLHLHTRAERPDNWVNVNTKRNRTLLPEIPALDTAINSSKEIPKPLGKVRPTKISTKINET